MFKTDQNSKTSTEHVSRDMIEYHLALTEMSNGVKYEVKHQIYKDVKMINWLILALK